MTKYILHGGFEREDNEQNQSYYREFVRDIPDGGTILLVYFASRIEDVPERFPFQVERIKEQAGEKNFEFVLATQENFLEELKDANAVHFRGGDTQKLLAILRGYSDFRHLLKGKTVSGSSAGAYALVQYGAAHSEKQKREGLGLLPLRLVCHFESPELPPSPETLDALYKENLDLELVLLRDYEWRVFTVD